MRSGSSKLVESLAPLANDLPLTTRSLPGKRAKDSQGDLRHRERESVDATRDVYSLHGDIGL